MQLLASSFKFDIEKNLHVIGAYANYLCFGCLWIAYIYEGFWFLSIFILLGLAMPLLDIILPSNSNNYEKNDFGYLSTLLLEFSPIGFALIHLFFVYLYIANIDHFSSYEIMMASIALGITTGMSASSYHEFIHRRDSKFRLYLARLSFLHSCFPHFESCHIYGHHKNAATIHDNHTGRLHESLYSYLARAIPNGFKLAWLNQIKKTQTHFLGLPINELTLMIILNFFLVASIFYFLGLTAMLVFLAQACIGIIMVESLSYIQHYGMLQGESNTTYSHSWDSDYKFSNYFMLMSLRHHDHHHKPNRKFYLLNIHDQSPKLPYSISMMLLMSAIPFVWHKIMDKEASAHLKKNHSY